MKDREPKIGKMVARAGLVVTTAVGAMLVGPEPTRSGAGPTVEQDSACSPGVKSKELFVYNGHIGIYDRPTIITRTGPNGEKCVNAFLDIYDSVNNKTHLYEEWGQDAGKNWGNPEIRTIK